MLKCPQCGFFHSDVDVRCIRCGTVLRAQGELDPLAAPGSEGFQFRPVRRSWIVNAWLGALAQVRRVRFFVHRALQSQLPAGVHYRNPWAAGLLGLIPGAGQLYNHQPKRAAILLAISGGAIALGGFTWYSIYSNYFLVVALLAWLYGLHDAFMTARAINRDVIYWTTSVATYFGWLFLLCLTAIVGQFVLGIFLVKFRYLFHDEAAPFLRAGERIGLNEWVYLWNKPQLGDMVYVTNYDARNARSFALEIGADRILIQPRNYIERVVGLPGDVFERRSGEFFRNGKPVPANEQPIVQRQIPYNFSIRSKGEYIVLMSYTGEDIDPTMTPFLGSAHTVAPQIASGSWIPVCWEAANLVPLKDIEAKVWFVYQPPPARRWLD